jgi:hypothetical protein
MHISRDSSNTNLEFQIGRRFIMSLNHLELQNLRHIIGAHDNTCQKLEAYAQEAKDPQVKAFFEQSARSAEDTKQKLISFLK